MITLLIYFIAFNFLEATLPSLISRLSPKNLKGLVLGAYNTSQSLGIFVGGILGGFIAMQFSDQAIFILSAMLLVVWFILMLKFIFPSSKNDIYAMRRNRLARRAVRVRARQCEHDRRACKLAAVRCVNVNVDRFGLHVSRSC